MQDLIIIILTSPLYMFYSHLNSKVIQTGKKVIHAGVKVSHTGKKGIHVHKTIHTGYSLIFFNVQGGACQFLIDNDKVDHYI